MLRAQAGGSMTPLPKPPPAPPTRNKNSSSKLIFAANVINTIARKEEKKDKTPQSVKGGDPLEDEQQTLNDDDMVELEKMASELPTAPKGKRRFIDYLLNKKSINGSMDGGSTTLAITNRSVANPNSQQTARSKFVK